MRHRTVRPLVALIALAAIGITPQLAAADQGAKSKIVIRRLTHNAAAGEVSSGKSTCVKDRKVSLFLYDGFVTDKVGITHTNSHGEWRVRKHLKDGRYFAKVEATAGCRYDNSKAKRLG